MKNLTKLQYRFQISAVLLILIAGIIVNNIFSKRSIEHVNSSVASIYNDRLLAASYIFSLDNALNNKRLMIAAGSQEKELASVDHSINQLIGDYDKTYLTKREKELWHSFNTNLDQYDRAVHNLNGQTIFFDGATQNLKDLSELQVMEGDILLKKTVSNINAFTLTSSLEICFSIVLGVAALSLIGASKMLTSTFYQRPSLN